MISNFVQAITGGFNGILTGFGSGVADFFQSIFLKSTVVEGVVTYTNELSTFSEVSLILMGVGAAFGIGRWVIRKAG